ncbi:hypothetical protein [Sphingobium fuliginis]|uniref:Uncharacterized protein n=1 Tax=Sphingobium fuliginis (strain ATCC 27551) TaxID=336203 RepID=A0ABQ1ET94_SPHSA|nr:hypothetical protein [Sphingobium fuliginis]RYL99663.1 hypothetical protein EWH10_07350 [Sphingobium fuliginis]GFZ86404.1 hypothetical protein GCM10019071_14720 [Sphingobium fuliginis]
MTSLIDPIVLRAIPEAARIGLDNKTLHLFGSVIRRSNGTIAYHLQEAAPLAQAFGSANPMGMALQGVSAASSVANNVQTEIVRQGVARVQHGIKLLQQMGLANLALGGVGLGVSVAGFAIMNHKLDDIASRLGGIQDGLSQISAKLDVMRAEQDRAIISRMRGLTNLFEESWELTDLSRAESSWTRIYQDGADLEEHILAKAKIDVANIMAFPESEAHLDAFALVSGLRIAAQLAAGEVESARALERRSIADLMRLTGKIGVADLLLPTLTEVQPGSLEWDLTRISRAEELRPTIDRLRQRESLMATRTTFLPLLKRQGASPREWLQMARNEQQAPVLVLAEAEERG